MPSGERVYLRCAPVCWAIRDETPQNTVTIMTNAPPATRFQIGAATLQIINVGDSLWTLAEELALRDAERAAHPDLFMPRLFSSQCVLLTLPGVSVLVDASAYDFPPDSPQVPQGYVPPPALHIALALAGTEPQAISQVVITHPHFDHINGLTQPDPRHPERWLPSFPNARHYLGRADWEQPELQAALASGDTLEARTLGVLRAAGLLDVVDSHAAGEIAPGVRIVAAPGETPGHQIVRVESAGQVAYSLGDLFHSIEEVARPEWMATWADHAAMAESRHALIDAALAEDALLVAAHIPGAGRLIGDRTGARWQSVGE
jgi:glyoxylase-like metal-dependent hydrolase (beta-lactamase superfamily II)